MEKGISYLNRDFHDYRNSLLEYTKQYYPELEDEFNDASIGSWMLDVVANIGDNLSFHIDRMYQETNIDSAQEKVQFTLWHEVMVLKYQDRKRQWQRLNLPANYQ
jgi:hypothetical protein